MLYYGDLAIEWSLEIFLHTYILKFFLYGMKDSFFMLYFDFSSFCDSILISYSYLVLIKYLMMIFAIQYVVYSNLYLYNKKKYNK